MASLAHSSGIGPQILKQTLTTALSRFRSGALKWWLLEYKDGPRPMPRGHHPVVGGTT